MPNPASPGVVETRVVERHIIDLRGLKALLRARCAEAGGIPAFADKHGTVREVIDSVLADRRPPARGLLDALGMERVVRYRAKAPKGERNV